MKVYCPKCNGKYEVEDQHRGSKLTCPACTTEFIAEAIIDPPKVVSGETKTCPMCGERILKVAKKCKHCGEYLQGKPKNKIIYVLLGFIFGGFGVHNFYGGEYISGAIKLIFAIAALVLVFSAWERDFFYLLIIIQAIWILADIITFNPVRASKVSELKTLKMRICYHLIAAVEVLAFVWALRCILAVVVSFSSSFKISWVLFTANFLVSIIVFAGMELLRRKILSGRRLQGEQEKKRIYLITGGIIFVIVITITIASIVFYRKGVAIKNAADKYSAANGICTISKMTVDSAQKTLKMTHEIVELSEKRFRRLCELASYETLEFDIFRKEAEEIIAIYRKYYGESFGIMVSGRKVLLPSDAEKKLDLANKKKIKNAEKGLNGARQDYDKAEADKWSAYGAYLDAGGRERL